MKTELKCTYASSATYCSCVCVACCVGRVLEVTRCVFMTAVPLLFYMATAVEEYNNNGTTQHILLIMQIETAILVMLGNKRKS